MAVALGTITFVRPNGMTIAVDVESQDAAGSMMTWDSGAGGATGTEYYEHPEELRLIHMSFANVTATPTALRLVINGTPTGQVFRPNLNNVSTVAASITGAQPLNIGIAAGAKIQMIALA